MPTSARCIGKGRECLRHDMGELCALEGKSVAKRAELFDLRLYLGPFTWNSLFEGRDIYLVRILHPYGCNSLQIAWR